MKRTVLVLVIGALAASCNRDHKRETILNYAQYVWKREVTINKLEDVKSITGKDSVDLIIKEYAKGITPQPPLDTILNHIEKDIEYNSKLLTKTNQRIDSLNEFKKKVNPKDDFIGDYIKTFVDLRDFTAQQIDELKYYRASLKRYSENKDDVFCYQVLCEFKLKGSSSDTTSKIVRQNFFLSADTRKIFLVK